MHPPAFMSLFSARYERLRVKMCIFIYWQQHVNCKEKIPLVQQEEVGIKCKEPDIDCLQMKTIGERMYLSTYIYVEHLRKYLHFEVS